MQRDRSTLSSYVQQIRLRDGELNDEINSVLEQKTKPHWFAEARDGLERFNLETRADQGEPILPIPPAALAPGLGDLEEETIVLRMGRPVVNILNGQTQLKFADTGSDTWRKRLEQSAATITPAINAVGRIEVKNHPSGFDYMGTGWVIDDGVIVTNRHVALSFAQRGGEGFTFLKGFDRKNPIGVDIDFLEEIGNPREQPLNIARVLYIAKDNEPDVAFLQLEPATASLNPRPIPLGSSLIQKGVMVAIIGYPARDSRIPDVALMDRIFGKVYDKKRLAPGYTSGFARSSIQHDCTTLGGNSGSPLIDLATGEVCGLHYSGVFLEGNYAVPAPALKKLLADVRNGPPLRPAPAQEPNMDETQNKPSTDGAQELCLTIPLEVTIKVGAIQTQQFTITANRAMDAGKPTPGAGVEPPEAADIELAVAEAKRLYGQRQDVYTIESGWKFSDGWITKRRAVIFAVKSRLSPEQLQAQGILSLPKEVLGVPTDVRSASLEETSPDLVAEARGQGWHSTYQPLDTGTLLAEVNDRMSLTLNASPDAGWSVLSEFLRKTEKSLTIGMYDFTAPHIIDAINTATKPKGRRLTLVLDRGESIGGTGTKKLDLPEADTIDTLNTDLRTRFDFAWAAVGGASSPVKSAYHIKVAVRDSNAFWLSSGNWQSSNQPKENPLKGEDTSPSLLTNCNREWHVVVEHAGLSKVFEQYLKHDLEQAKEAQQQEGLASDQPMIWVPAGYFQPNEIELEARPMYTPAKAIKNRKIRVQPLLTPDNYAAHALKLIESAKERIYFQNQSMSILETNPEHYEKLLQALLKKQQAGLDVRVVIRKIGDLRTTISRIKDYGFDTDRLRVQTNCHNKGIIVDSKTVMLGSQNWTGDGTGPNRDASLIFFDDEVTAYYEGIFLYDWGRIGQAKIDESLPAPEATTPGDYTPRPGMVLIPLSRWLGEG